MRKRREMKTEKERDRASERMASPYTGERGQPY